MTRQCILGMFGTKCARIPYRSPLSINGNQSKQNNIFCVCSVISNWRHTSSSASLSASSSPLFQFDGGDGAGDKFAKMRTAGYLFVDIATIPPSLDGDKKDNAQIVVTNNNKSGKSVQQHSSLEQRRVKCIQPSPSFFMSKAANRKREAESVGEWSDDSDDADVDYSANHQQQYGSNSSNRIGAWITLVHTTFELLHSRFPAIKNFLLIELFPRYAAFVFV